jgi:sugar lactone lactonase YvrE
MVNRFRLVRQSRLVATACATLSCLAACSGGGGTAAPSFSLGGTISGLVGGTSGLVLTDGNASTAAQIASSGTSFTFGMLAGGSTYNVAVSSSPAGMTCTVAGGSGTLSADVANVVVTCSDLAYTVGGTIAPAAGSSSESITGLVLANGSDTFNVPSGAVTFTMPTPVAYTSSYQVTVRTQPNGMSCAVVPGTVSTMPAADVTSVTVTCSDQPYTLGGTVSISTPGGVAPGTLSDQGLVLHNTANNDSYTFNSNAASFAMPARVPYGDPYALAVATQPVGLSCAVNHPTGTMPASNVALTVSCSDQSFMLSGTVNIQTPSGVAPGELSDEGLVLTNSANGDTYAFSANASAFTMPLTVPYGSSYAVAVTTQPTGLSCTANDPSATMPAQNVSTIVVTCADQSFTLGGSITGLGSASGLVLTNEAADATTILANATAFTMNTAVPYGAAYQVAVSFHPSGFGCTVASGAGTMPANAVASVGVSCAFQAPQLQIPFGVAVDAAANVYVADPGQPQVMQIAAGTGVYTPLGSGFTVPVGVAVDTSGNVYVADIGTSTITEIAAGTGTMSLIGSGFSSPWGVAVDASGTLYVADAGNNAIKQIAAGTGVISTLGSGFNGPEGVAVDASGNVYVADTGNNVVKKIAAGNGAVTTLGSGFSGPVGVAVDASGNVYVGDYNNNAVKEIAAGTGVITTLSSSFDAPAGVAVDTRGNVYVADSYDGAIREFVKANGALIAL